MTCVSVCAKIHQARNAAHYEDKCDINAFINTPKVTFRLKLTQVNTSLASMKVLAVQTLKLGNEVISSHTFLGL